MVVTCDVLFDKNQFGSFHAGQLVTGSVTLKSDKIKEVKAVTLVVTGEAYTSWSEKVFNKEEHYSGRENYFTNLVYLLGSEESTKCTIQAGIHEYKFDFQLPYICPTSLESQHGHIRYMLKVNLIRPWKFNQSFTKGFTVINLVDLNRESASLRQPSNAEVEKTYGCGPCRSEPMHLHVSLGQSGFLPGQTIPITIVVTNDSHVPIVALKIYLIMIIICRDNSCINENRRRVIVSKLKGDGVLRHCKKLYNYELEVPATPPTLTAQLCRIINVNYEVNVQAYVKGMHASQVLAIPVTIGNVPFNEIIENQPRSLKTTKFYEIDASEQSLASTSSTATTIMMETQHYDREMKAHQKWIVKTFTELPPKYETANHTPHANINAGEKHDYGDTEFRPYYPVFSLLSSSKNIDKHEEK